MKLIYSIILIGLIVHTGHAQKTDKITPGTPYYMMIVSDVTA